MQKTHLLILFLLSLLIVQTCFAWRIGQKGRSTSDAIHTTYFLTPFNQPAEVQANAFVGYFANNYCRYSAFYDLGKQTVETGDMFDISAFRLRDLIGSDYSCMTIYYYSKQSVYETIQLIWDGNNYYTTLPETSEVTIL